jgi:hypothetical protein
MLTRSYIRWVLQKLLPCVGLQEPDLIKRSKIDYCETLFLNEWSRVGHCAKLCKYASKHLGHLRSLDTWASIYTTGLPARNNTELEKLQCIETP